MYILIYSSALHLLNINPVIIYGGYKMLMNLFQIQARTCSAMVPHAGRIFSIQPR